VNRNIAIILSATDANVRSTLMRTAASLGSFEKSA
jgi:hypothetical protein